MLELVPSPWTDGNHVDDLGPEGNVRRLQYEKQSDRREVSCPHLVERTPIAGHRGADYVGDSGWTDEKHVLEVVVAAVEVGSTPPLISDVTTQPLQTLRAYSLHPPVHSTDDIS